MSTTLGYRSGGNYPRAEQFLSLMKLSDEVLGELIEYFEGVDEKTLIVFFGDHQPSLEEELFDKIAPNRDTFVTAILQGTRLRS